MKHLKRVFVLMLLTAVPLMPAYADGEEGGTEPAPAAAESEANAKAEAQANADAEANAAGQSANASAQAHMSAEAQANARAEAEERKRVVLEKGEKVSSKARARAEKKIDRALRHVHNEIERDREAKVAARLAAEFGVRAEALVEERARMQVTWGDLMVARSLAQNGQSKLSVAELCDLRRNGAAWARIAAGMGFDLNQVVRAVDAETRVARGHVKADGRVAAIGSADSKVRVDAASSAGAGLGSATRGVNGTVKTGGTVRINR